MNKLEMEKLILEDVLHWVWKNGDPNNKLTTYKNTRSGIHFNPSNIIKNEYESLVFAFMREKFHPALVQILSNDNWEYFRGSKGNVCGHTAGYGAYILAKVFEEWEIGVVRFSAKNICNHAVIVAQTENGNIIIDLDRKDVESIWWNTNNEGFHYPSIGKLNNIDNLDYYGLDEFINEILPESPGHFKIDKEPDKFKAKLHSLLDKSLNDLISKKPIE